MRSRHIKPLLRLAYINHSIKQQAYIASINSITTNIHIAQAPGGQADRKRGARFPTGGHCILRLGDVNRIYLVARDALTDVDATATPRALPTPPTPPHHHLPSRRCAHDSDVWACFLWTLGRRLPHTLPQVIPRLFPTTRSSAIYINHYKKDDSPTFLLTGTLTVYSYSSIATVIAQPMPVEVLFVCRRHSRYIQQLISPVHCADVTFPYAPVPFCHPFFCVSSANVVAIPNAL